jgi:hypothetical protein
MHWTGHSSRLDRALNPRFGEEAYAMEELVAELGAALVCADLDLVPEPREQHAAYIVNRIEVLKMTNARYSWHHRRHSVPWIISIICSRYIPEPIRPEENSRAASAARIFFFTTRT